MVCLPLSVSGSRGAIPILTDVLEERLAFAREKGISFVYNNKKGGLQKYLTEITEGKLPEYMVECTGSAEILKNMHEYVCSWREYCTGRLGQRNGIGKYDTMYAEELNLFPSRNSRGNFPEAIQLICKGEIPVVDMTTQIIAMEEIVDVIRDMIKRPQNYLKVVAGIDM